MSGDFMDGFGGAPPPRPAPGRQVVGMAEWQPGQAIVLRPAIVCPHCGSPDIKPYDNGVSSGVERWECNNCSQSFKLPKQPRKRCWYPG